MLFVTSCFPAAAGASAAGPPCPGAPESLGPLPRLLLPAARWAHPFMSASLCCGCHPDASLGQRPLQASPAFSSPQSSLLAWKLSRLPGGLLPPCSGPPRTGPEELGCCLEAVGSSACRCALSSWEPRAGPPSPVQIRVPQGDASDKRQRLVTSVRLTPGPKSSFL